MKRIGTALLALAAAAAILSSTAALSQDALERAISLAAGQRYAEARHMLDPLLQSEPGSRRGRLLHGILRLHEGDRDEAVGIFRELVREFPDLFEAYNNLAVLYAEEGRLDDARGILLGILDRRPEAVGYRNLGDIYASLTRDAYARARELGWSETTSREGGRQPGPSSRQAEGAVASAADAGVRVEAAAADPMVLLPEPAATAADPDVSCLLTGGFRRAAVAEDAARWLESRGAEGMRVSRETRERIEDYRVYISPLENRESATRKMQELRGRGVVDVAVILRGALKNGVSVGVYANEANAARRASELRMLGYSVILEANRTTVEEYTTIEARIGGTPEELRDAWPSRFAGHPIRHVDCT